MNLEDFKTFTTLLRKIHAVAGMEAADNFYRQKSMVGFISDSTLCKCFPLFEGALNIDFIENDSLEHRLIACLHRVQEAKYLMRQTLRLFGENRL